MHRHSQRNSTNVYHPVRKRDGGFTFVELLLVLAILAVTSLIALPRMSNSLNRYRVQLAAQRVAADINLARTRANSASASRTVTFEVDPVSSVTISDMLGLNTVGSSYTTKLGDEPYEATITSADFGGTNQLQFNGFGLPVAGGTIVVQAGAMSRTIVVDPQTGEAQVQ